MDKFKKRFVIITVMGLVYLGMEFLFRGYSHWTMFIVGGVCGYLIDCLNEGFNRNLPLVVQGILGSTIVTTAELISGYVLNIYPFQLNIWDYSNMPYNYKGLICLQFSLLWIPISIFAVILGDLIRNKKFNEKMPKYRIL